MKTLFKSLSTIVRGPAPAAANFRAPSAADLAAAREKFAGLTRLHLGCGTNLLDGWANVDLSGPPPVIELDLTHPLPVADRSFDRVYCEHFIEHITLEEGRRLVAECHRVLRPGGIFRVSTPSLEKLVGEYRAGRLDEWHDMHWKPQTPCQLLNESMRLWGHQFLYDRAELTHLLESAGFTNIVSVGWRQSEHAELRGRECRPFHDELIIECTR